MTRARLGVVLVAAAAATVFLSGICAAQQIHTLVVAAPQTPTGFDGDIAKVATRQMAVQAYEGLVRYRHFATADGHIELDATKIEPHFAESWEISPDGKVYTFKLRQGVKSPFGNEMTADDIVWSWQRAWAIKRTTFFLYNLVGVDTFETVGRYEVKITLKAPSKMFLPMLTMYFPLIHDSTEVKKHATTDDPWGLKYLDQNLVGFGPYYLNSLKPGEQAELVANPNYFRGKPYYERVIYREVPSAANRVALLKTGQVQWLEDLTLKQIVDFKKDSSVKVESVIGTQPATIRMNPAFKPFDDVRVRQAMAYATDYDAMNRSVFEGLGVRVRSVVPPNVPDGIEAQHFERDTAKAKALLRDAGFPDGVDVTLNYAGTYWWMEPIAIQFKNQALEAGIRVNLQRLPDPEFVQRGLIPKRDMPFFTAGDATFVLDPIFTEFIFGYSNGTANRNAYKNDEFDKLTVEALAEQNDGRRTDLAKQMQTIHANDASWIMLFYPGIHQAMAKCIKGWAWYPDDWPRFFDLRCDG